MKTKGTVAHHRNDRRFGTRHARRESKRRVVRLHERVVLDVLRRNRENYAL